MAVRRNSAPCAVALLQSANALYHNQSGGWMNSDEDETSAAMTAAEEDQQRRDFNGQAGEGSRRLNKVKDKNGDTPLHWAVKINK